jgi:HK97 family phage portal protein
MTTTVEPTFWSRVFGLLGLGGLQRNQGDQYPTPSGYGAKSAKPVTWDTAMQVSAFWAGIKLTAETVAGLPLVIYQVGNGKRTRDTKHALARLFAGKVNRYQTRVEFFETLVLNIATWGNAYCRIERDSTGDIVSLMPLMSAQVTTRLTDTGALVHEYRGDNGIAFFAESSIWHVKLFGNGVVGLSPLGYARNSLGIAQASEDSVGDTLRNGAKPSGILMVDSALDKAQRQKIREAYRELVEDGESMVVLDKFMKYESVSMSPQDIELLNSRRFQMEDIARFVGVPSVLINDTSASTAWGSGIQQIIEGWYKLGLRPYLERIEESIKQNLMTLEDRLTREVEFDFDNLLRMDALKRFEAYDKAIQTAQLTPNEARAEEGREPKPGGDQLYIQGAMMPITQAASPRTQVQ